jgi:hypothetical protein
MKRELSIIHRPLATVIAAAALMTGVACAKFQQRKPFQPALCIQPNGLNNSTNEGLLRREYPGRAHPYYAMSNSWNEQSS